jgi:hypothetical protein
MERREEAEVAHARSARRAARLNGDLRHVERPRPLELRRLALQALGASKAKPTPTWSISPSPIGSSRRTVASLRSRIPGRAVGTGRHPVGMHVAIARRHADRPIGGEQDPVDPPDTCRPSARIRP